MRPSDASMIHIDVMGPDVFHVIKSGIFCRGAAP